MKRLVCSYYILVTMKRLVCSYYILVTIKRLICSYYILVATVRLIYSYRCKNTMLFNPNRAFWFKVSFLLIFNRYINTFHLILVVNQLSTLVDNFLPWYNASIYWYIHIGRTIVLTRLGRKLLYWPNIDNTVSLKNGIHTHQ